MKNLPLMGQLIDSVLLFLSLDFLDVGEHLSLGVVLGELLTGEGVHVETGQSDELPGIAHLAEVGAEVGDVLVAHACGGPVEAWGQVVGQQLVGVVDLDELGELAGDGHVGGGGLHPDHVGDLEVLAGSVSAVLNATLGQVVSLGGSASLPIEVELEAVVAGESQGVPDRGGVLEGVPLGLLLLELGAGEFALEGQVTGLGEGEGLLGVLGVIDTEDEGVVDDVGVVVDELGAQSVGSGDDNEVVAHDVGLETGSDESLDVLLGGDDDLACHVTAFLGAGSLVFNVDTGGTGFDHELGELHHGGDSSEPGITIGDDGAEVVDSLGLGALVGGHSGSGLVLLAVVEQEGLEQLVDFVGDGVHGVIGEVRAWFVGDRGG